MNRITLSLFAALLCTANQVLAAQTTLETLSNTIGRPPKADTNFTRQNTMNTELYNGLAGKTNLSAFASQEAFLAAFGWVGGGLADATADSQTYGRLNGAWVPVLNATDLVDFSATPPLLYNNGNLSIPAGSYQPPLVSEENLKSLTIDGSVISLLGTGTVEIHNSQGAEFQGRSKVTADPTATSANGLYQNIVSGHWWYVDGDGLSDISAGTYAEWDITPTSFGWGAITEAVVGDTYCYGTPYVVAGIDRTAVITATGAATYKINGGSATSSTGTVALGDSVVPCLSVPTPGTTVTGNVSIGEVVGNPPYTLTSVSPSAVFLDDTFAVGVDTPITTYGSWVMAGKEAAGDFNVLAATGEVDNPSSSYGDVAYHTVAPPSADYTVTVVGKTGGAYIDRYIGAGIRWQTDGSGYGAILAGNGDFKIVKYPAGVSSISGTVLSSVHYTISETTYYEIILSATGNTISATLTGSGSITATDYTVTSAGHPALILRRTEPKITSIRVE